MLILTKIDYLYIIYLSHRELRLFSWILIQFLKSFMWSWFSQKWSIQQSSVFSLPVPALSVLIELSIMLPFNFRWQLMVSVLGEIFDVGWLPLEIRFERSFAYFSHTLKGLATPVSVICTVSGGVNEERVFLVLFSIRIFLFN